VKAEPLKARFLFEPKEISFGKKVVSLGSKPYPVSQTIQVFAICI